MTTIYLIRHSKANNKLLFSILYSPLEKNKKQSLTKEGKNIAKNLAMNSEFNNVDIIYSSDYKRARKTAKYLANKLHKKVIIDNRLGERDHGIIKSYDEVPADFYEKQLIDSKYKLPNGESQEEVLKRVSDAFYEILNANKGKVIAIFGHSTATTFLLKTWCDITYDGPFKFKNKIFFDGHWNPCQTFKLIFDEENNLKNIETIKL